MKAIFIVIGVIVILFILSRLYFMSAQKDIEQYPYKIVKTYNDFEIRNYEGALFTSVKLNTGDYDKTSSKGFSILAGYIFGGNSENKKIAMTSPVAMTLEENTEMLFLVPKAYAKENLPEPNNKTIEFKEMPAKKVAAITFGGWANDQKIAAYKEKLSKLLDKENIEYTNKFFFLGYNAPMEVVNRKNEVIVELK